MSYSELQSELRLDSLETRRKHHDLKLLWGVLNHVYHCPDLLSKIPILVPSRTTRSSFTFYQSFTRTNYAFNSFLQRSTRLANLYSNELDIFSSRCQFNRELRDVVQGFLTFILIFVQCVFLHLYFYVYLSDMCNLQSIFS